jgi:hypothetical protein
VTPALFSDWPTTMMSRLLGWIRMATAWSFPWKLVVRTPLLSKVVSRRSG